MHWILFIVVALCLLVLLSLVGYATWRLRRHLLSARQPPRTPGSGD
ncbi:MAG TPA: hypothetical protein VIC32_02890 [Terriglobales bacterium]